MSSNTDSLTLQEIEELARQVAEHHDGYEVCISFHVAGYKHWSISVSNYNAGGADFHMTSQSGTVKALKEIRHIAKHGVDFTKKGSQL